MESNDAEVVEEEGSEPIVVVPDVVVECRDYSGELTAIHAELQTVQNELKTVNANLTYCTGFLLFGVIVALCVFGYKLLRIFF